MKEYIEKVKDAEMREYALKTARRVRCWNSNGEFWRDSTPTEENVIFEVMYGALCSIDWGGRADDCMSRAQGAMDMAEFMFNRLVGGSRSWNAPSGLKGYETVYIPLQKYVESHTREEAF